MSTRYVLRVSIPLERKARNQAQDDSERNLLPVAEESAGKPELVLLSSAAEVKKWFRRAAVSYFHIRWKRLVETSAY